VSHREKEGHEAFCFFLDVFIAGLRSATVVLTPISYVSPQKTCIFGPIYQHTKAYAASGKWGEGSTHGLSTLIFGRTFSLFTSKQQRYGNQ
jgi:hypothetical protein